MPWLGLMCLPQDHLAVDVWRNECAESMLEKGCLDHEDDGQGTAEAVARVA